MVALAKLKAPSDPFLVFTVPDVYQPLVAVVMMMMMMTMTMMMMMRIT